MKKSCFIMVFFGLLCSGCAQKNVTLVEPVEVEAIVMTNVLEAEEEVVVVREYVAATGQKCQEVVVADSRGLRCSDGSRWQMMPVIYP